MENTNIFEFSKDTILETRALELYGYDQFGEYVQCFCVFQKYKLQFPIMATHFNTHTDFHNSTFDSVLYVRVQSCAFFFQSLPHEKKFCETLCYSYRRVHHIVVCLDFHQFYENLINGSNHNLHPHKVSKLQNTCLINNLN